MSDSSSSKQRAASAALSLIRSGMTVGLGTGSTATLFIEALGQAFQNGTLSHLRAVPTSQSSATLASRFRIPIVPLSDVQEPLDVCIDGADEVDPSWNMIKGRGGAMLHEKIVAEFAAVRVYVVTLEKRVETLGSIHPVPVEVSPIATEMVRFRLSLIAQSAEIRHDLDGSIKLTDEGNAIVDCRFATIPDPKALENQLLSLPGVFETGLFLGHCDVLIVGLDDRVEIKRLGDPGTPLGRIRHVVTMQR